MELTKCYPADYQGQQQPGYVARVGDYVQQPAGYAQQPAGFVVQGARSRADALRDR